MSAKEGGMTNDEIKHELDKTLDDFKKRMGVNVTQCYIVAECWPAGNVFVSSTMTRNETRKSLEAVAHQHRIDLGGRN